MTSTAERLAGELLDFLTPVSLALDSPAGMRRLLGRLGHEPTAAAVAEALDALAATRQRLSTLITTLGEKAWANQPLDEADYARIAQEAPGIVLAVRRLPDALEAIDLGPDFASEILDLLVVDYLRFRAPAVLRVLVLLGVLEIDLVVPGEDGARAVAFERYRLRWDRLRRFIVAPSGLMQEVYAWGRSGFAADRLLDNLAALGDELGVVALPRDLSPAFDDVLDDGGGARPAGVEIPLHRLVRSDVVDVDLELIAFPVKGRKAPVDRDRGIAIMPYVGSALDDALPISDDRTWALHVEAGADLAGGIVFRVHPSGLHVDVGVLDSAIPAGSFRMEVAKETRSDEVAILLVGDAEGSRLEADGFAFGTGGAEGEFYVAAAIRRLRLVLDASGDGLLSHVIPKPIEADAGDVVVGWRPGRGIYIEQGSGLTLRIPLNVNVAGVLRLHELGLRLALEPGASLTTLVSASASIGPLTLAFEDLGLEFTLTGNPEGAFGVFDLDARIVFPSGYAVGLEAGPVAGGGALFQHDHEYRGVLALKFETMGFSAFAILTTRLPGGRDGYSFLASIFGEFDIPLGYGFFLTGLGGIIGINRAADSSALREVVAEGTLDNLLFPADPIAQAPRIIDALSDVFPARVGTHVFGPVARIAFGRPTLVEGKLGLVLEVGERIRVLILGVISSDLPSKAAALVSLRASFFGEVDIAAGTISLDASLNPGSRVLTYAISGDVAARTGWAPRIDHVISFGGLHPAYPRPANLPDLRRLSINFGSNNPRVTLSAYFAVTTNSLQFGAEASLYAKGPDIMFVGQVAAEGEVYLHALVYFDPFAFEAQLGGSLSLLVDGDVVLSLGFDLQLSGPNPFRVAGQVWATVWGFDVGFGVDHSWGEERPLDPPTADPVVVLRDALVDGTGLEPIPSTTRVSGVVFPPGPVDLVVDPAAGVRYLQRAVPLGIRIDKLGEAALSGGSHRYDLAVLGDDGNELSLAPATTDFVRGHFWALTNDERLRAPAFERHAGGFVLGGDDLRVNVQAAVDAVYGYEVIVLPPRTGPGAHRPPAVLDHPVVLAGAVFDRWSGVHRQEVAQPLNPEALAAIGAAALSVRATAYIPRGGTPQAAGPLSQVLESVPARGRTASANPAVATYVAAAAA